eukprot:271906-Lingulodinium_polyedra.AAC.1
MLLASMTQMMRDMHLREPAPTSGSASSVPATPVPTEWHAINSPAVEDEDLEMIPGPGSI